MKNRIAIFTLSILTFAFASSSQAFFNEDFGGDVAKLLTTAAPNETVSLPKDDILEVCDEGSVLTLSVGYYYFSTGGVLESKGHPSADLLHINVLTSGGANIFSGFEDVFIPGNYKREDHDTPRVFEAEFVLPVFDAADLGLDIMITSDVTKYTEHFDLEYVSLTCADVIVGTPGANAPLPGSVVFMLIGLASIVCMRKRRDA